MNKLMLCLGSFLLLSNVMAADTVNVLVGTQTYKCTTAGGLNCAPVNAVQQQQMTIKKDGGSIQIADAARGLSVDIDTSVDSGEVIYDATFCSSKVCTLSSNNGGSNAYINQTMLGQYNITESSFFVLGFFITSQNKSIDLKEKALSKFSSLKKNL